MEKNLVCSECGGMMEIGYIPDTATSWNRLLFWVGGSRKKQKGIFENYLAVAGMTKYYITSYRCEKCGFLKLYAGSDQSENQK